MAARPAQARPSRFAQPPFTRALATVKPNLMFILDDSGSMVATYMPQELKIGSGTENGRAEVEYYGFRSAQCNGLASTLR